MPPSTYSQYWHWSMELWLDWYVSTIMKPTNKIIHDWRIFFCLDYSFPSIIILLSLMSHAFHFASRTDQVNNFFNYSECFILIVYLIAVVEGVALRHRFVYPQFGGCRWTLGVTRFRLSRSHIGASASTISRYSHSYSSSHFSLYRSLPFHRSGEISQRLTSTFR